MKIIIEDEKLSELANSQSLIGKQEFPAEIVKKFKMRLSQIQNAVNSADLRNIKSLHFEKLKEKRYKDKYSIRLNDTYRLIFRIDKQGNVEIICIEEISKHYS